MDTGKERLRRWREKNRAEGKQSFTVMLSKEAVDILSDQKQACGASYAAIIEKALLEFRDKPGITFSTETKQKKKTNVLIDENGIVRGEVPHEGNPRHNIYVADSNPLSSGFIPRLLKRSNQGFYKLKKRKG